MLPPPVDAVPGSRPSKTLLTREDSAVGSDKRPAYIVRRCLNETILPGAMCSHDWAGKRYRYSDPDGQFAVWVLLHCCINVRPTLAATVPAVITSSFYSLSDPLSCDGI